jgi:hypothetical protein
VQDLIAYRLAPSPAMRLLPASRWRDWMNATVQRWANRCLPLLVANESGWVIENPYAFEATWDGGDHPQSLVIEFDEGAVKHPRPGSHFGYGIITWAVPYLFRTPPGYNLLARGPANWPKDGICALEGLVETDWSVATFTMNWKMTRAGQPVRFEQGEPFCMVVPQPRGLLTQFSPRVRDIRSDPEAHEGHHRWSESRHELTVRKFLSEHSVDFADANEEWQRHYFKGVTPDGSEAPYHETQLRLPPFEEETLSS